MNKNNEVNTYMFHNQKYGIYLYTKCTNYEDAMDTFDLAGFENREEWKIFIECGDQPA